MQKNTDLIKTLAARISTETMMIKEAEEILSAWKMARIKNYEIAKREGIYLEVIQEVQNLERNKK